MSDLKFASNLFLEVEELNRLKLALRTTGYQLDFQNDHEQLGVIKNQLYDPNFTYFQVLNINVANTVYVSPGFAYDTNRNVLTSTGASLLLLQQNTYYWLKMSYKTNNTEQGTVNIGGSAGGLLSGSGTAFTTVLRGQPNFPSKISFLNSANYQGQYELLEVDNDNVAYLQGSFPIAEANLQYAVVGTFTPGTYPPIADQYPFLYDDFNYTLIPETGTDVMPPYQQNTEFYIARVISTAQGIQIQDRRQFFVCQTRAERLFSELPTGTNRLIGIEAMAKTAIRSKVFYTVNIQWGFRISTESRNYNANLTTVTTGYGGIYASANAFSTGDFDGWRYYYQDGKYSRIVTSVKNGSGIDLQLDSLRSEAVGVMICPNAEEIEINLTYFQATSSGAGAVYAVEQKKFYIFTLNPVIVIDQDDVDNNYMEVDLQFRYKTVLNLTDYANFNQSGYTIPGLNQVYSQNILLTLNNSNPTPVTAWRGINPYCILDTLGAPLYYTITTENSTVIPTVYYPNSSFPITSDDETTVDVYANFFSDSGLTVPVNVTHPNLRICVKQEGTIINTVYDTPQVGDTTNYNAVVDNLLVYMVSPAGVNTIKLATLDSSNKSYSHPTNQVATRRITNDTESTYAVYPNNTVVVGNTGYQGYNNLEEYNTATSLPTGNTKPNLVTDPNYIAPTQQLTECSIVPPNLLVTYGYSLAITEVQFTGTTTGVQTSPTVANTTGGGYQYLLPQFLKDETVVLKANIGTQDTGNLTGFVWVRVTWVVPGSTSVTYTNQQVAVGVLTQLNTTFTNIQNVNISNY